MSEANRGALNLNIPSDIKVWKVDYVPVVVQK